MKERRGKCMYYYVVGVQEVVVVIVAVFAVSFFIAACAISRQVDKSSCLFVRLLLYVPVVVSLTPPFMTLGIDKGCVPIHYVHCVPREHSTSPSQKNMKEQKEKREKRHIKIHHLLSFVLLLV